MSSSVAAFSVSMLGDMDRLKGFFNAERTLTQIKDLAEVKAKSDELYYSRWTVAWIIVTSPLLAITSLFCFVIGSICPFVPSLSKRLILYSGHLMRDIEGVYFQLWYGKLFLIPSYNDHRMDSCDLYTLDPIPKEKLPLPILKENLHYQLKEVDFSQVDCGLCHGGVNWFNFLYLESKSSLNVPLKARAVAVAAQFVEGQPRQAAVLQALYGNEAELLDLVYTGWEVSLEEESLKQKIHSLPDGAYYVKNEKHAVSLIKKQGEMVIWDPAHGLFKVQEKDNLKELLDLFKQGSTSARFYRCEPSSE